MASVTGIIGEMISDRFAQERRANESLDAAADKTEAFCKSERGKQTREWLLWLMHSYIYWHG